MGSERWGWCCSCHAYHRVRDDYEAWYLIAVQLVVLRRIRGA